MRILFLMLSLPVVAQKPVEPTSMSVMAMHGKPQIETPLPKVLAITIPKAGTYILGKLFRLYGLSYHNFVATTVTHVDSDVLKKMPSMHYSGYHLTAEKEHFEALIDSGYRIVFIYRDPRDQVVSAAYFIKQKLGIIWEANSWPVESIISRLIIDCSLWYSTLAGSHWHDEQLKNVGTIKDFYDLFLGWRDFPGIYVTAFEKMVGAKGGGDDEVQYRELQNIAKHCGIPLNYEEAFEIQKNLFGGTDTFRNGKIGAWKSHFTEQDKVMFKKVAGQLLIDLGYETDFNW